MHCGKLKLFKLAAFILSCDVMWKYTLTELMVCLSHCTYMYIITWYACILFIVLWNVFISLTCRYCRVRCWSATLRLRERVTDLLCRCFTLGGTGWRMKEQSLSLKCLRCVGYCDIQWNTSDADPIASLHKRVFNLSSSSKCSKSLINRCPSLRGEEKLPL